MDEVTYMKIHGIRFLVGFGLFLIYILFIASWEVVTPSSQAWMTLIVILLSFGIILPWVITGVFFRRYRNLARHQVINSFFVAPNVGLFSTLTIPPLYVICKSGSGMFIAENWSIMLITTLYYALNINVNLLQLWHAKKLKTQYAEISRERA